MGKIRVFKVGIMCLCGSGQKQFTGTIRSRKIGTSESNTRYLVSPLGGGSSKWVTRRSLGFLDWKWEDPKFNEFEDKIELVDASNKV